MVINNLSPFKIFSKSNSTDGKQQVKHESFYQAVGPALWFGQFFAMLPVGGVLGKSVDDLNFSWRSPQAIYSMIFLICGSIETVVGTRRLIRLGFNIHLAEAFLFFTTTMFRAFFIFRLATKWKTIMVKWRELEDVFLSEPFKVTGWKLSRIIRVVFGFLMAFVLGE
jgi:gustatory receptor